MENKSSPGKMKAVKEEIEEDDRDDGYKPELLASAKNPNLNKVEEE